MRYKKAAIVILVLILISFISSIQKVVSFDPSVSNWYSVASWEMEFCRKWGGSTQGGINQGAISQHKIPLSVITISIQGERIVYPFENATDLYKANWYIEPVSGKLDYTIRFIGNDTLTITSGEATYSDPGMGYYTNYLNKSFTHVRIAYPGNYIDVPFVIQNE